MALYKNSESTIHLPYLMNADQASLFLGISRKSFDKYVRTNRDLKRFMIGTQERFTSIELSVFVNTHVIPKNYNSK